MTTENLIAIAKACGWEFIPAHDVKGPQGFSDIAVPERWTKDGMEYFEDYPFNYDSLDSLQQAVLMQDEGFQREFAKRLFLVCSNKNKDVADCQTKDYQVYYFHQLTIPDWQQAFVETLKQLKRL